MLDEELVGSESLEALVYLVPYSSERGRIPIVGDGFTICRSDGYSPFLDIGERSGGCGAHDSPADGRI